LPGLDQIFISVLIKKPKETSVFDPFHKTVHKTEQKKSGAPEIW